MSEKGVLNRESMYRVDKGCELFSELNADYICFVGWPYRNDCEISIAEAMNSYQLTKWKIDQRFVLLNKHSRDTVGDAIFTKIALDKIYQNYDLIVVSSDYHIPRVRLIFESVYGKTSIIKYFGSRANRANSYISEKNSIVKFRETFKNLRAGDIRAFSERLIARHPYYNGDIYTTISLDSVNIENL